MENIIEYIKRIVFSMGGNKEDIDQILDEINENGCTTFEEVKSHLENYYL